MKKILLLLLCGYVTNVMGDCTPGQYNDGSGCTNCPLTQFSSTTNAPSCTDISTCVAGQYVSAGPSGTVVQTIFSNDGAFAALRADGSVVAWGSSSKGGTTAPSSVTGANSGVDEIFSTEYAFAALKTDGSVVAWGESNNGGCDSGLGDTWQSSESADVASVE